DERHAGIGNLVDDRGRRRPRHVDVAGDHRAGGGSAVIEWAYLDVDAMFFEEALLFGDVSDRDRKDRWNAGQSDHEFLVLRGGWVGAHQHRTKQGAAGQQTECLIEHGILPFPKRVSYFSARERIQLRVPPASAYPKLARAIRQSAARAMSRGCAARAGR